jgi:rare lipoprotein A
MRSTSFRTAQLRPPMSFQRLGAGALMIGLALSASAKDGTTAGKDQQPAVQVSTKAGHKGKHWLEVGIASWYGAHFQGRATATGEPYDMNLMTCAHPTLPMGTWLRVTNLKNRKTAFVRVNDRGPVVDGRIVDLSYAAAQVIGLSGVGKVKLESIRADDPQLTEALVAQLQMPVLFNPLGR